MLVDAAHVETSRVVEGAGSLMDDEREAAFNRLHLLGTHERLRPGVKTKSGPEALAISGPPTHGESSNLLQWLVVTLARNGIDVDDLTG
ncbi:hypothetical protein [Kribbella swartbergensis]